VATLLCFYCEGTIGECRKAGWACCADCTHDAPGRNSVGQVYVMVPVEELHALEDAITADAPTETTAK
jgi:hypothetical protein